MQPTITSYCKKEESANAISHGLGALLSCIALYCLINQALLLPSNNIIHIVAYAIYGASLIVLFLASTCYHAIYHQKAKQLFKLLDHCAIYLLIAGTYTPLLLITLAGPLGYSLLTLIWLIALAGIAFKVKFGNRYKKLSLATYLGMGFISFAILGKLSKALPSEAIMLLVLGGLIYCVGVLFYVKKHIRYTHAIWHLFVLIAAMCHFYMIYLYV